MGSFRTIQSVICGEADMDKPFARRVISAFPDAEVLVFHDDTQKGLLLDGCGNRGIASKSVLLLDRFKGRLIQKCPATKGMICCNYRLINSGFNCIYNCAYCYLQSYLNSYGILLFTNEEDILAECGEFIKEAEPAKIYRIGTGEFTDSLMLDHVTGLSTALIGKFAPYPHLFLELKTKSGNVDHLLNIPRKGSTVIAWSVNTPRMIERNEDRASLLPVRLAAAARAAAAGYFIAFHFDPVIIYDGWEKEYDEVVEAVFASVPQEKVLWISMGCFRYAPQFRDVMRANFPDETISDAEFVQCPDGKMRYPKPVRRDIYRKLLKMIRNRAADPYVYMCMESADMWESVFGRDFAVPEDLEEDMSIFLKNKLSDGILSK